MGYCFKIYGDHFNSGDKYAKFKKYCLFQVNFNNYNHDILDTDAVKNNKEKNDVEPDLIREYYLIDVKNHKNYLSKNLCIINVDIAGCFKLVYNEDRLREMSDLEKFGALLKADNLKDISHILEKDMIEMEEKDKFLEQVVDMSKDKDVLEAVKFEDSIDYRFNLVEEDALERGEVIGLEKGKVEKELDMIKNMLANDIDIEMISKVSGKTTQEIKEIENSMNE